MENLSTEDKISIIKRQTSYTDDEIKEKLIKYNDNYMSVIKDFMGIEVDKKQPKIKSINQEIYKQIRHKLDNSMTEYNNKNPVNMTDVLDKLG